MEDFERISPRASVSVSLSHRGKSKSWRGGTEHDTEQRPNPGAPGPNRQPNMQPA